MDAGHTPSCARACYELAGKEVIGRGWTLRIVERRCRLDAVCVPSCDCVIALRGPVSARTRSLPRLSWGPDITRRHVAPDSL
jgi:hypothetical protein